MLNTCVVHFLMNEVSFTECNVIICMKLNMLNILRYWHICQQRIRSNSCIAPNTHTPVQFLTRFKRLVGML
jgi:hypothetical protein